MVFFVLKTNSFRLDFILKKKITSLSADIKLLKIKPIRINVMYLRNLNELKMKSSLILFLFFSLITSCNKTDKLRELENRITSLENQNKLLVNSLNAVLNL